jgi:U3 small nucleolar RNA-associated protein 21
LLHVLSIASSITALELHRDSGLLSVSCDDLAIRLVDMETRRIVRELRGFKGRILDAVSFCLSRPPTMYPFSDKIVPLIMISANVMQVFSPDSRWLIATSLDSTIRTFDIPTGRLVDAFRTSSIATSLTFSPKGDFLATAHVDSLGVHLW